MEIGIFAKTFSRPTLGELLDAIAGHGIACVQFNLACVGLPTVPAEVDDGLLDEIRRELAGRKLGMAALSGTFNMIHPDRKVRQEEVRRFRELTRAASRLGTPIITLCTGTRHPTNMWRPHPDNSSPAAWADLLASLTETLTYAEEHGVNLGVEPEPSNVVADARRARRLLDELKSPRLKIVMDGANLLRAEDLPRSRQVFREAFDLLGNDVALAHAKDVRTDGGFRHVAAGRGILDYDHYLSLLADTGFDGPLILHQLEEAEVDGCMAFLRQKLAGLESPEPRGGRGRFAGSNTEGSTLNVQLPTLNAQRSTRAEDRANKDS